MKKKEYEAPRILATHCGMLRIVYGREPQLLYLVVQWVWAAVFLVGATLEDIDWDTVEEFRSWANEPVAQTEPTPERIRELSAPIRAQDVADMFENLGPRDRYLRYCISCRRQLRPGELLCRRYPACFVQKLDA